MELTSDKEEGEQKKESDELYHLIDNLNVGFFQCKLNGQIINYNPAFKIILGYDSADDLHGLNIDIIWPESEDRLLFLKNLIEKKIIKNHKIQVQTNSSKNLILELNSCLIYDNLGNPNRIDGTIIDITEKFNLEHRLKESEQNFRDLVNSLPDVLVKVNLKGRFVYASPQLFNIFGFKPSEILNKSIRKFVHPDDLLNVLKSLKKAYDTKNYVSLEYRTLHKDGNYIYVSAKGLLLENGEFYGIVRDISDKKKVESKLKESEEKYRLISETAYDLVGIMKI